MSYMRYQFTTQCCSFALLEYRNKLVLCTSTTTILADHVIVSIKECLFYL